MKKLNLCANKPLLISTSFVKKRFSKIHAFGSIINDLNQKKITDEKSRPISE